MLDLSKCVIGIELGSTRIKAVLIDENSSQIASGNFDWKNNYIDGIWTYSLSNIKEGLQTCYASLAQDIFDKYSLQISKVAAIGVSAMMHGYLVFDKNGEQLVPFRTWRNTITEEASGILSGLFDFNIPQRWSIAHLYQSILNNEEHVSKIAFMTTLSGYIHYLLTGEKVIGIGDASGMFPIDSQKLDYDEEKLNRFDNCIGSRHYGWSLREILPKVVVAGKLGGKLTKEGSLYLDPTGKLSLGIPVAPPEGDAGTGMVATNSIKKTTGNVSVGTSSFAMFVCEKELNRHREVSMVTTPAGLPVAMIHCANGTSCIDDWVNLFMEFSRLIGNNISKKELYQALFEISQKGSYDGGGLVTLGFIAGEDILKLNKGFPFFFQFENSTFNLANFMKVQLLSCLSTLKIGMDILRNNEAVRVSDLRCHGGFFKVPKIGQRILSSAVKAPVTILENAAEGGPFGMALLASFMVNKKQGQSLEDFISDVFLSFESKTIMASDAECDGFDKYITNFKKGIVIEKQVNFC